MPALIVPPYNLAGGGAGGASALISSTTLGSAGNLDLTSIPSTFSHLQLIGNLRGVAAGNIITMFITFNGDAGANYAENSFVQAPNGTITVFSTAVSQNNLGGGATQTINLAGGTIANQSSFFFMLIPAYANTNFFKQCMIQTSCNAEGTASATGYVSGEWHSTAAINRITLTPSSSNFAAGSQLSLYGLV